ncbi:MAG: prolyl-tRNA synthetase [Candidatus Yonathbacteria bacterium]|nr:prolyl-tRNA synthetase [Candidatus Yonathbacteria bacterium]
MITRQSQLFTRTRRNAPKDEVSKNAQLLVRAGFIHKELAGVYSFLPLGLRVLKKIEQIIREEMNAIGGQEIVMTALQEKDVWEKTGRWDDKIVDAWFKTKLKNETELGLAYTHEPALTALMKDFISSYRDLPSYPYQFQTKFRNELRAKSGLFRGREFVMKDLYSFSKSQSELDAFYETAIQAYRKVFTRVGLGDRTYLTIASGGTFGTKYSHEFQTLTKAGEDTIYIHKGKNIAINKEVMSEDTLAMLGVTKEELVEDTAVEVGNIYKLGTFYSAPLDLTFKDEAGKDTPVIMGSYGIGLGRVMGTIVETSHDDRGMIWPMSVAPFTVHLMTAGKASDALIAAADEASVFLGREGIDVLYDDRHDAATGTKFADADLIGIPWRMVMSEKTIVVKGVEIKNRRNEESKIVPLKEALALVC